jgi:molecular chaperone GrpE (heat shock protein)
MTANELADFVEISKPNDKTHQAIATMLRQQQAEIEQLKKIVEDTIGQAFYEDDYHKAKAEIEALKKKLENLPMSLKDDIEYWSKK